MNDRIIYIFGHKNPDTDSVCSAIALSYLKRELGMNTIPAILGDINRETQFVLQYFNTKVPKHINDARLQLKDVSYHKGCFIDKNESIFDAFNMMNINSLTGIPIIENKNKYFGYASLKEIAREIMAGDFHRINTTYDNILETLNGKRLLKYDKEISGNVLAATYAKETFVDKVELKNDSILIVGDRKVILDYAIESKVKLIIIVKGIILSPSIIYKARKNKVNIISTNLSSYEVGKLISLSNYIGDIIRKDPSITFNEVDYLSDFKDASRKLNHTNYPILGNKNECKGVLTLTDCNEVEKKQVILVDHNNASQSIDGLEEAEILEIIDHHNIGDIITKKPINFRNASTGSVNTIIYDLFLENNIEIPPHIAGLMASAIISDTLLLTSPTTTIRDTDALISLSRIAKINYKSFGKELLKHGMSIKGYNNEQLLYKDFKSYKINDVNIGIGQILSTDYENIKKKLNSLVEYLDNESESKNYKVLTLFVTDIFNHKSYIIYNKACENTIKDSFKLDDIYEGISLPNVLSRKSQIVPYIMDTIEKES